MELSNMQLGKFFKLFNIDINDYKERANIHIELDSNGELIEDLTNDITGKPIEIEDCLKYHVIQVKTLPYFKRHRSHFENNMPGLYIVIEDCGDLSYLDEEDEDY